MTSTTHVRTTFGEYRVFIFDRTKTQIDVQDNFGQSQRTRLVVVLFMGQPPINQFGDKTCAPSSAPRQLPSGISIATWLVTVVKIRPFSTTCTHHCARMHIAAALRRRKSKKINLLSRFLRIQRNIARAYAETLK